MPNVYDIAQQFRASLISRDQAAAKQLIKAYGQVWISLQKRLKLLTDKIEEARASGEVVNPAWLRQQERFIELLKQVNLEVGRFAEFAGRRITAAQRAEITRAIRDAETLAKTAIAKSGVSGTFNRLPVGAVEMLAGALSEGSPVMNRLRQLAPKARETVKDALMQAVAQGLNPRQTAKEMRNALGGNLTRALTIARTEQTRAYREASRTTYQQNSDVVSGWQWTASKSSRTCLNCLSRDGKIWPLEKPLPAHPNCRCVMVPVLIDHPLPKRQTGAQWFESQPAETKRAMMGNRAFELYRQGKIKLSDFEGEKETPEWGLTTFQRSLVQIERGEAKANPKRTLAAGVEPDLPSMPRPVGKPVSAAIQLPRDRSAAKMNAAVAAIDSVHGDGELPSIPVRYPSVRSYNGRYTCYRTPTGYKHKDISINKNGDHQALSLVHEIGHFLDQQAIGKGKRYASLTDQRLEDFRKAAQSSRAIQELKNQLNQRTLRLAIGVDLPVDRGYIQYLLQGEEIWARAYAQYIALKSGDNKLREQLQKIQNDQHPSNAASQWSDNDFEPIADAIDALLKELGWRL